MLVESSGRSREGLGHDDREAALAAAIGADVAQPRIGDLAAELPADDLLDGGIVGCAGYPNPHRALGVIAGEGLRLLERLAAREQAAI